MEGGSVRAGQSSKQIYKQLLCALYSLREGIVIGTNLGNFRALENHVFANYRMFYRYFLYGVKCYQREEDVKVNVRGSTAWKHIQEYKRKRGQTGFLQHTGLDPLVRYLFPEISAAMKNPKSD